MSRTAWMSHTIIWCHSTNVFCWNSFTQWCNWCLGWVLVCVREVRLRFPKARFAFSILFLFFFALVCETNTRLLLINSSCKVWLFPPVQHKFYCLRTHKFHFSETFSLKMGPAILFTHLKIILLQYFSVSIFNFQLYSNGPLI